MERRQIIEFKERVSNKLDKGSKWMIQLVGTEKYNHVIIRMGKRGEPLSTLRNDNNLEGISTNSMNILLEKGIVEVVGRI